MLVRVVGVHAIRMVIVSVGSFPFACFPPYRQFTNFAPYHMRKKLQCTPHFPVSGLRRFSVKTGRMHVGCMLVMDLSGLGRRHIWGVKAFNAMMKACEPNFPERLSKICLIRAPWIFPVIYKMVKPALAKG